ncbi:tail fiber domain-containing protein [uncultured Parabacteroides sp.]|uniref:tail fiber domain-containing protein n=1 Tax=uncultured Parabacteroides sp. TaxID=512312 RepID=UPI0025ED9232|nr:tail fiber domain-containing protein [uncultured Parabacteroides sp.]
MAKQYTYKVREIAATPRTGRTLDSALSGGRSSGGDVFGGLAFAGYWSLITTDKDNNPLEETAQYIKTKYHALSEGDVVAYATSDHDIVLPHAGYGMVGCVQIKPDSGLIIDSATGLLYVDPDYAGGGGVAFTPGTGLQMSVDKVLSVKYGVAVDTVAAGNDSRILNGQKAYDVISKGTWWGQKMTEGGVVTGALSEVTNINNKLTFVDTGVDVTDSIRATGDVVAYATAPGDISDWLGLVIDNETIKFNSAGKLYSEGGGGGIAFTPGTALQLTSSNVLNVLLGTTGTTACAGNDSRLSNARQNPYSLTWSGYSSGSYNGASAANISIPSNTNQLTNGAGYITGISQNMILNALTGSGSSSKYLAGNGTFYTVGFSELSGIPSWITGWNTNRFNLNSNGGAVFKSSGSMFSPSHSDGVSSSIGIEIYNNQIRGLNDGASSNYYVGNLYLNYVNSSKYVRIDGDANLSSTGDVVAYSTGSAPSPFKYWYPSVDTSGNLSWSNSTSEVTPATRNIRGPQGNSGPQGQGVTYGWSGTSLRIGTISSAGSTSWGSYVNLVGPQGPKGDTGATGPQGPAGSSGTWNGGTVSNMVTIQGNGNRLWFSGITSGGGIYTAWNEMRILNTNDYGIHFYTGGSKRCTISSYLYAYTNWSIGSDMRFKTRLSDFTNVLNRVRSIDVFYYLRTDLNDGKTYTGVSAQQLNIMFPEFVTYDKNTDRYGVTYDALGACVAVQGIKEILKLVEDQQKEINELKNQLKKMAA